MRTRRQFLTVLGVGAVATPVAAWLAAPAREPETGGGAVFPVRKSDDEWRRTLSPDQYRVLRGHATERAFSSPLDKETRKGTYVCAGCGQQLFSSDAKFDSRTGWPSFWQPLPGAIGTRVDRSWLMVRTEVHCARCGGHLGHVFSDGPRPTGLRYCMNGAALRFVGRES